MTTVGIICECNPMHGGHEYLIRRAKKERDVRVLCVMSGCFVQRGEAAIAEPYLRAEALVRAGADAVVELPFPSAASGAEFFARAGVEILSRLGADEIWFGSECGDIDLLRRAAEVCESAEFQSLYAQSTADNSGTAEAYFDILQRLCGEGTPLLSNDHGRVSLLIESCPGEGQYSLGASIDAKATALAQLFLKCQFCHKASSVFIS